jgi:hypothetical protein
MPRLARSCTTLALAALVLACDGPDAAGCDDPDAVEPDRPLASSSAWRETPADADPLASHREGRVACTPADWGEEFGVLEVSTISCDYASVEQPLAGDLAVGDRVRIELWWAPLWASEPAEAHLALLVEDRLLWDTKVAIPSPADARAIEFDSPVAAAAGDTLTFHLHNHGQNSWTLASVERLEPGSTACP